ncbi:hypothetical protein [Belliella pelovolcani]|uniref:hypothetical protein n=1 Tax=Belliella pelovolcani TaxID=529505 RepID=UPI00391C8D28
MEIKKIICILTLIFSNTYAFAQFKLQKTSEFSIKSLNSVEIVDYDPIKKQYIAFEKGEKDFVVLLLDEKGDILKRKELQGQGPGEINTAMNFLGFGEGGNIWVITTHQLLIYDRNLELKESKKFALRNPFLTFFNSPAPVYFYKGNGKENLVFATYPSRTARFMSVKSFDNQSLIELFDMKSGKEYYLAPISERPIYKHLDISIKAMYKPLFTMNKKKDQLLVTSTFDDEITVIDLQTSKTISKIKINHGDFGSFKKFPISRENLSSSGINSLTSQNSTLLHLDGGMIVLDYFKEIPKNTFEAKIKEDKYYRHSFDPNYHRIIIFDEEKQLSKDLEIPHGQIKIAMPNNSILVKLINPDEEEDFVRYGVYQITK